MFVIRAEKKGTQIPVGTFEIERKVCQPVEPLLVKGMLRALRIENRPNDTRVLPLSHESPPVSGLFRWQQATITSPRP